MVLICLIKGVFFKKIIIYKNEWEYLLTYYHKNWAKDYYESDKERLREQARNKYRYLSEEEKIKKENIGKIDIAICLKKRKKE